MADYYVPSSLQKNFADFSAFVADANAINGATKTALELAITNISNLFGSYNYAGGAGTPPQGTVVQAAHPDFNDVSPAIRQKIQNELLQLNTAITNHA